MDTTISVKSITVDELLFVGQSKSPRWNATVSLGVECEFGNFVFRVKIEKAMTLDDAVGAAIEQVVQWGSARLSAAARLAISRPLS